MFNQYLFELKNPISQARYSLPLRTVCNYGFWYHYKTLDAVVVQTSYPIPLIKDHIDYLDATAILPTLDANCFYFLIAIFSKERKRTAFSSPDGFCKSFERYLDFLTFPLILNAPWKASSPLWDGYTASMYLKGIINFSECVWNYIAN